MGYSLYIEKESEKISLEEWKSSVNLIDGAKLDSTGIKGINPTTKEEIVIQGLDGDTAILMENNEWETRLFFTNGRVSFRYHAGLNNLYNPQRIVVSKLAELLNAIIVGDEGEIYDW